MAKLSIDEFLFSVTRFNTGVDCDVSCSIVDNEDVMLLLSLFVVGACPNF